MQKSPHRINTFVRNESHFAYPLQRRGSLETLQGCFQQTRCCWARWSSPFFFSNSCPHPLGLTLPLAEWFPPALLDLKRGFFWCLAGQEEEVIVSGHWQTQSSQLGDCCKEPGWNPCRTKGLNLKFWLRGRWVEGLWDAEHQAAGWISPGAPCSELQEGCKELRERSTGTSPCISPRAVQ